MLLKNTGKATQKKVSKYRVDNLIQEVCRCYSTIYQLRVHLFKLLKTLNQHEQYLSIAKIILSQLSNIYKNSQLLEKVLSNQSSSFSAPEKLVSCPSHFEQKEITTNNRVARSVCIAYGIHNKLHFGVSCSFIILFINHIIKTQLLATQNL
ncbi:MAG: hypothetical protein BRC50_12575 [Cyanobacteria bacterium SW_11_48_12]|nr:MAG: hypothetical protein BRC50_12575 [Cyanobacteria bacterium SW_11_48_12]